MDPLDKALLYLSTADTVNYAATARKFGCDETTLRRRHQGKQRARREADYDYKTALTEQQERDLVTYIQRLTNRGIPPTLPMVRNFARDIAKKELGKTWAYRFVNRHRNELDCSWFEGFDIARKKADDKRRYRRYFELLEEKIEKYDIQPENIYNADEKGFLLGCINRSRRVFARDTKNRAKLIGPSQDGNRTWITLLACICQDGTYLPPFLIYPSKARDIQDTWVDEVDPEKHTARFVGTENGWTNHEVGKRWLEEVFDRFSKGKARHGRDYRLLISDGHSSHVNMAFLEWCEQHRVIVAVFPPHSTHRLQPLDVSLFSPLSTYYTQELVKHMAKTQGLYRLSKRDFWSLFWPAYQAAFTPKNIESSWKQTGLHPFDPNVVLSQLSSAVTSRSRTPEDCETSVALVKPTARELRHLITKVVRKTKKNLDIDARKLLNTIESLQTQVEVLEHENAGLREAIRLEKIRRQHRKPLRNVLFDIKDANEAIVYSPQKIAEARARKAELDRQEQDKALQKEVEKAARAQAALEKKEAQANKKRLKEEEKEKKRLIAEQKKGERELARQLRYDLKQAEAEKARLAKKEKELAKKTKEEVVRKSRPKSPSPSPPSPSPITPPQPNPLPKRTLHKLRPVPLLASPTPKPFLSVESPHEVVTPVQVTCRPQRNSRRPAYLDDYELD